MSRFGVANSDGGPIGQDEIVRVEPGVDVSREARDRTSIAIEPSSGHQRQDALEQRHRSRMEPDARLFSSSYIFFSLTIQINHSRTITERERRIKEKGFTPARRVAVRARRPTDRVPC